MLDCMVNCREEKIHELFGASGYFQGNENITNGHCCPGCNRQHNSNVLPEHAGRNSFHVSFADYRDP